MSGTTGTIGSDFLLEIMMLPEYERVRQTGGVTPTELKDWIKQMLMGQDEMLKKIALVLLAQILATDRMYRELFEVGARLGAFLVSETLTEALPPAPKLEGKPN